MSSDRVNFFGFSEDKLYYDEKRKRFVNTANSSGLMHRQYYMNHFKDVSQPRHFPISLTLLCLLCSATSRSVRLREERVQDEAEVRPAAD